MANVLADSPDFHIDLGDTFMTDKHESRKDAARQYLAQRYYFGQIAHSVPLFLVLGNHDGESPRGRDGEADSLAVWSQQMRTRYFPNPVPGHLLHGQLDEPSGGRVAPGLFAWEWGDALFVVLDPFWYSNGARPARDNWTRTLGAEQYRWLAQTLAASDAHSSSSSSTTWSAVRHRRAEAGPRRRCSTNGAARVLMARTGSARTDRAGPSPSTPCSSGTA